MINRVPYYITGWLMYSHIVPLIMWVRIGIIGISHKDVKFSYSIDIPVTWWYHMSVHQATDFSLPTYPCSPIQHGTYSLLSTNLWPPSIRLQTRVMCHNLKMSSFPIPLTYQWHGGITWVSIRLQTSHCQHILVLPSNMAHTPFFPPICDPHLSDYKLVLCVTTRH